MPLTEDLDQHGRIHGRVSDEALTVDARRLRGGDPDARDVAVEAIRSNCLNTGFFYLDCPFETPDVVADVLSQMQRFYGLPDSDPRKQAVSNEEKRGNYGWMPLFGEPAYQPGTIAYVESFDCGRSGRVEADKTREGDNVWPDLPGFRRDIRACWDAVTRLGNDVLDALSDAAGLEPGFLTFRCDSQELNTMRLLHYPPNDAWKSAQSDTANVGIAAHTDFECMTLIYQNRPGLELTDVDGNWYDAPSHDGRIVVLLDDMLERWTNGFFKATGHRVRNTGRERYSIVMFFAVNDDEVIAPLPQFVSAGRPAGYPAIGQRDHIDAEMQRAEKNREEVASARLSNA